MPARVAPASAAAAARGGPSPALPSSGATRDALHGLRCTPSRRSLKFSAGPHARHFLAFDSAISRETRLLLFMELFVFRHLLLDATVVPAFQPAVYTPEELLEVRVVTDPRHPAYGQAGLYAKSAIPHNTIVTPYAGFIEVFATSCNSRTYTMGFGSIGDDYALDAEFVGNYGRYANDPRGVGTLQANLSAENRFNSRGESFTALVARRQISAGEEILMSYGKAHRLSSTPWMTMQGEPIMRPRMGGVVPFPAFRSDNSPPSLASMANRSRNSGADNGAQLPPSSVSVASTDPSCDAASQTTRPTTGREEECFTTTSVDKKTVAATSESSDASPPLRSVANDLLWECTQCGMWNLCEASLADTPQPCSACRTPKLSGARFMSLLSSPAVTQLALLQEAGIGASCVPENSITLPPPPPLPSLFPAGNARELPSPQFVTSPATASPASVSPTSPASGTNKTPSSSSPPPASTPVFRCEHSDWPMNVPFLPWQVWDAAVPLSVLAKHSRFETQEHMFLYAVDTGVGEEKKKERGRERSAHVQKEESIHSRRRANRAELKRSRSNSAEARKESDDESSGSADSDGSATRAAAEDGGSRGGRGGRGWRRGRGGRAAAARAARAAASSSPSPSPPPTAGRAAKKTVLWERQGDVDPADLARLHRGLTPATPHLPSPALDEIVDDSAHPFSPFALTPRQLQRNRLAPHSKDGREEHPDTAFAGDIDGVGETIAVTSPLPLLMTPAPEIDRLLVLRRGDSVGASQCGAEAEFSPQLVRLRHRLQCMTHRLFTGKTFQPGDVVSNVGGLVRHREDTRCRASNSCLEIPLRYFLPPALRRLCRALRSPRLASSEADSNTPLQSENPSTEEEAALLRFCQRVDSFSLVVTNEFMYCPCVVVEDGGEGDACVRQTLVESQPRRTESEGSGGPSAATDEVASVLSACNVALVLTLDSLGCPYACAVATKAIGAFEPLLARAQ